jgi:hypothetical protein
MSERTETALREAMHAFTDAVETAPDAWEQIESLIDARTGRRRRPLASLVGAVALVTAIALVVFAVGRLRDENAPSTPAAAMPERIVSVIEGNLVVLDSESGNVVRTLTGAGQPGRPSVSGDGYVYFSRHPTQCEIARVRLAGGRPEVVAHGQYAEVSPNGRWLAITRGAIAPCDGHLQFLDVVDLRSEEPDRTINVVSGNSSFLLDGWSPDSRRLLVRTIPAPQSEEVSRAFEIDRSENLGRDIVVPTFGYQFPGVQPRGYLGPLVRLGRTGLLANVTMDFDLRAFRIVAFDPMTGDQRRVLARGKHGNAEVITSDVSGRHLLYWVTRGQRTLELWRRTAGERPVLLRSERARGSGGLPAVWVP